MRAIISSVTGVNGLVSSCHGRGDTAGTGSMDTLNPSCAIVFSLSASCPRLNLLVSMLVPQPDNFVTFGFIIALHADNRNVGMGFLRFVFFAS